MKRQVRREANLPSFSLGIAELSLIWERLDALFVNVRDKAIYLDVEFDDEKLTFDDLSELTSAKFTETKSTDFTLHCHGADHSLHLYTALHAGSQPKLVVTSESEAWAAGAREVVLSAINQNRVWHYWLRPKLVAALLFLAMLGSVATTSFMSTRKLPGFGPVAAGLAAVLLILALLYFARRRFLPMATLRLVPHESFWRRYSVELTLALAFLSVLLTAYGLFAKSGA